MSSTFWITRSIQTRSFKIASASSLILRISESTSTEKRLECERRICADRRVFAPSVPAFSSRAFAYSAINLSDVSTSRRLRSAYARSSAARSSLSPIRLRQKKKQSSAGTPMGQTKIMRPA